MSMEDRFRGFRIGTTRLRDWNYASRGMYFVTFCVKDRVCCLADVETARWDVSHAGQIVTEEILFTERVRPNIMIDSWIVMPDHVHMIIEIMEEGNGVFEKAGQRKTIAGSLGQVVNQLKGAVTKRIRAVDPTFAWLPRFYGTVIRDDVSLERIREYIRNNPQKWREERTDATDVWM